MKIINPSVTLRDPILNERLLYSIVSAGRVAYKSEDRGFEIEKNRAFVRSLISRGHESVLEHASLSFHIVCDRGTSHELVRHRNTAYTQESTRYVNYSNDKFGNEITVIRPPFHTNECLMKIWEQSMRAAEKAYMEMLAAGAVPQEARSVLPNSLKTEVVMTANIRQWRSFIKIRHTKSSNPPMRDISGAILDICMKEYPDLFFDIPKLDVIPDVIVEVNYNRSVV